MPYQKNKDKWTEYNKDRAEDQAKYYANNKEKWADPKTTTRERAARNKEFIKEYKQTLVCEDCGYANPLCFEFHHKDDDKIDTIANMVGRGYCIETLKAELAKCGCLCANCHRLRHDGFRWKERSRGKTKS